MIQWPQVWSSGGGTQSVAIAALIVKGRLPKPDFAAIADTGREKSYTWWYHDSVVVPALRAIGLTLHRVAKEKYATVDLVRGTDVLIPAFTDESGSIGKLSNFCSNEWKRRVIDRWLRDKGVGAHVRWIGFSKEEQSRIVRLRTSEGKAVRFPLFDDIPMGRTECLELVANMGWPEPPRSACWMCPNQSDLEWMQNTAEDQSKAEDVDRQIRQLDPNVFLHRSMSPLSEVTFRPKSIRRASCDSGQCFV
jgi:hypothetical protein